jgi:acyl-coenzyme A thioesterase 9
LRGLEITPPTYEESVVIHKLNQIIKANPENFLPISSTTLKNTMLMHIEDKNLSGKVFGGLILRMGYELGWLCASKFLKSGFPVVTHVDDVLFLAPV